MRTADAEQIAEVADVEMIQPYPAEPNTWASHKPIEKYHNVMAIVATEYSERGAELVRADQTVTDRQNDLLAVGEYADQQKRLCVLTGGCSEGCHLRNTKLRTIHAAHGMYVEHVCRHTLRPCKSVGDRLKIPHRLELLERLRVQCRELLANSSAPVHELRNIDLIILELDGPSTEQGRANRRARDRDRRLELRGSNPRGPL